MADEFSDEALQGVRTVPQVQDRFDQLEFPQPQPPALVPGEIDARVVVPGSAAVDEDEIR
jgi:hypothetical protein